MARLASLGGTLLTVVICARADAQLALGNIAATGCFETNRSLPQAAVVAPCPSRPRGAINVFRRADLLLASAFVLGTVATSTLDEAWNNRLQAPVLQSNATLARSAKSARNLGDPGSILLTTALYAAGRLTSNRGVADAGLHATEAVVVSGAVSAVLKGLIGRARPFVPNSEPGELGPDADEFRLGRGFGGAHSSFPSGHTTVAFAAASALTRELSQSHRRIAWLVGPLLYGGATTVALSRVYENQHWTSDVVAGAAVGTLIGRKVVEYQHQRGSSALDRLLLPNAVESSVGGIVVRWSLPIR